MCRVYSSIFTDEINVSCCLKKAANHEISSVHSLNCRRTSWVEPVDFSWFLNLKTWKPVTRPHSSFIRCYFPPVVAWEPNDSLQEFQEHCQTAHEKTLHLCAVGRNWRLFRYFFLAGSAFRPAYPPATQTNLARRNVTVVCILESLMTEFRSEY